MEEPLGGRHPAVANAERDAEAGQPATSIARFVIPITNYPVRNSVPRISLTDPLTRETLAAERSNAPHRRRHPIRRVFDLVMLRHRAGGRPRTDRRAVDASEHSQRRTSMTRTRPAPARPSPSRRASPGRRRSPPGSAVRWSTTTSSSTAPPRPWSSEQGLLPRATRPPGRFCLAGDVRRRLRRPPGRRLRPRARRRQVRPQEGPGLHPGADGRLDLPRRLPAHLRPGRGARPGAARGAAAAAGPVGRRRAGRRELDDARARAAGRRGVLHAASPSTAPRPGQIVATAIFLPHRRRSPRSSC